MLGVPGDIVIRAIVDETPAVPALGAGLLALLAGLLVLVGLLGKREKVLRTNSALGRRTMQAMMPSEAAETHAAEQLIQCTVL